MDNYYKTVTGAPFKDKNLTKLINFLNLQGLDYDENVEFSVNIENNSNNIIATGSLDNNIIKCLAVDQEYRNEGLSAKVVTLLINHAIEKGVRKLFVYTKPKNERLFKELGFYTISKTNNILLMENEKFGFKSYLEFIYNETQLFIDKFNLKPKKIGCIIANCNPFTNGHLYLMDTASKKCDLLHVFILSGSNKYFNEKERINLVKEGLKEYKNIIIHPAKEYILSPLTFPTYFIKDKKQTSLINCELDINIFVNKIAPLLNITQRFLGTEKYDLVTNSYNEELIKSLSNSNIRLTIIDRKTINCEVISASTVRKLIDLNDFEKIKNYVPYTTYEFIISKFSSIDSSKK